MSIRDRIKRHEGLRLKPYRCPAGKLSIGYGRNLEDNGISQREAEYLLDTDLTASLMDIDSLFWGIPMTENRKDALVDMRFQLGYGGFRTFRRMIAAVLAQNWRAAAIECLESDYARQCAMRAQENAADLENG